MSVNPLATSQQIAALQPYRPPPPADAGTFPPTATGATGATSQGATQGVTQGATRGTGGTSPFQKLADDLQAALLSLQGNGAPAPGATAPGATMAGAGRMHGHHRHASPGDGTEGSAVPAAASALTASTSAPPPKTFVADMMQALQAYMTGQSGRTAQGSQTTTAAAPPGMAGITA